MAKTKISIKKRRQILRDLSISFSAISFILVIFEFLLTLRDDWDDINMGAVFVAPLFASVALMLAMFNIVRCHTRSKEIIWSLAMVGLSALFFCYVMVITTIKLKYM